MPEETVFVGKDELKIQVAPITLVYSQAYQNMFYPERVMIDADMSIKHFNQMRDVSPFAAAFFKIVVPDYPDALTIDNLKGAPPGFQHVLGLLDLSLQFILHRKKFGWRYPETYLHPKYQANLADAMLALSNPQKFVAIITDVKKALLESTNGSHGNGGKME